MKLHYIKIIFVLTKLAVTGEMHSANMAIALEANQLNAKNYL